MAKVSIYSNPNYCISFESDTVFVNLVLEITRHSDINKVFTAEIKSMQLVSSEEAFPLFLLRLLPTEKLDEVMTMLKNKLVEELEPSLFSLFYVGELKEDATNTTS